MDHGPNCEQRDQKILQLTAHHVNDTSLANRNVTGAYGLFVSLVSDPILQRLALPMQKTTSFADNAWRTNGKVAKDYIPSL